MWFQDEARFGQQNPSTRICETKGTRPRVVRQQQLKYAYLFGAVCPATGATDATVIMDGAGWHQKQIIDEFNNVTIISPYSPELNPIEQVWLWLRPNELANRCFAGYEDISEQCSRA